MKQRFERELNPVSRIDYQSLNNFLLLPRRRIIDEYLRHWSPLIFDRSCEIKNLLLRAVLSPPHRDTRAFPRFQRFVLAFIESSPYSMNPEQRIPFSLSHLAIEDLLSPPCLSSAKLFLRFRDNSTTWSQWFAVHERIVKAYEFNEPSKTANDRVSLFLISSKACVRDLCVTRIRGINGSGTRSRIGRHVVRPD